MQTPKPTQKSLFHSEAHAQPMDRAIAQPPGGLRPRGLLRLAAVGGAESPRGAAGGGQPAALHRGRLRLPTPGKPGATYGGLGPGKARGFWVLKGNQQETQVCWWGMLVEAI